MQVEIERYQDTLPAVRVSVADDERLFLLDTGAGITCISPELATACGAEPWGQLTSFRMTGERVDMQRVDGLVLQLAGVRLAPLTVGVLDLATLLPEGWPPVDGVLALDAFIAQPLTLDLAGRTLWLESATGLEARAAAGDELAIRVSRPVQGWAREVFVAAELDGRTWWLELDTGNTAPVLLAEHTGLEEDGEISLDLGGTPWTGAFLLQEMMLDGNLGQSFLAGRLVTLDLQGERMFVAASSA